MTERRFDPRTGEWTTIASHRQDRTFLPATDSCPLCPTTDPARATEVPRDSYEIVVFDNKFPALTAEPPAPSVASTPLYPVEPAVGATEVVLYSENHDLTLADMGPEWIGRLIEVWADRFARLGSREEVAYVFIFENKGEATGVTLHHPHGQIYAYPEIPPRPRLELETAMAHLRAHETCVFCDIAARERADGIRIVAQNASFLAFVPFAARFPYEVHVMPRRHAASLLDLTDPERAALAELLDVVLRGYDRLFDFSMPYIMSMHQAPTDDGRWQPVSHLHLEFTPPHRTATKLKYLAGSELGGGAFLNDAVPEQAAAELRAAVARAGPGR
jgi:UDPglucose--hexose-1-phosphate uridylyltransferase